MKLGLTLVWFSGAVFSLTMAVPVHSAGEVIGAVILLVIAIALLSTGVLRLRRISHVWKKES